MSLWLDSLWNALSGYDGGYDGPPEIAKPAVIFDHLAMPVPRSWWERCLQRGKPREDHVQVLSSLFDELKEFPKLQGRISYSLLVAMAFLDEEAKPSFGIQPNQQSIEQYIAAAKKVLSERPDVRRLGKIVTKMAGTLPEAKTVPSSKPNVSLELKGRKMAKLTCPKCKMELNEVLYVDESVMEFVEGDDFYLPWKPIMSTTKCPRCGSILEQHQEGTKAKIACPNCGIRLDVGIGVIEALMEYDENEEGYLNAKEVSGPKITRCLNCGADLKHIHD